MQAQDLAQVRWALASRCTGATIESVDLAFASRQIVRAWCMRGTLHVVPAEDLPWLLRLLGKRNLARAGRRLRELAVSDGDVAIARKVAEKALRDGPLSREELFSRLEQAGQGVAKQRGVHLLFCLTQSGVLCQAGEKFALIKDWIGRPRALSADEALGELARRYRKGHGPATVEDFAFWTGLPKREAKRGLEIAGAVEVSQAAVPPALLLAAYDEYLLGYADRAPCLDHEWFERIVPGGNGIFLPMLVLNGRVCGTWRVRADAAGATITVRPFARLSAAHRRATEIAAGDLGAYLGSPIAVRLA